MLILLLLLLAIVGGIIVLIAFLVSRNQIKTPTAIQSSSDKNIENVISLGKNSVLTTRDGNLDFYGQSSTSPNGHFVITWEDADPASGVGGFRKKGLGSYMLLQDGRILLKGKLERPNDGKVSNSGIFVIHDWTFSDSLAGIFFAIDPSGNVLIRERYKANLDVNAISGEGWYAACQTCRSDFEAHSDLMSIFDLRSRSLIGQFKPVTGRPHDILFNSASQTIHLVYPDKEYRYLFNGTFLDQEKWEKERMATCSGYDLITLAENRLNVLQGPDIAFYTEPIALLKEGIQRGVSEYTQARVHRLLGEIYHRCGDTIRAISHFESALQLNPKIGVKKLCESLKKAQQTD